MNRIDKTRIDFVGGVLCDLYNKHGVPVHTARTEEEDYSTDLLFTRDGKIHNIEVKTLKQKYYYDPDYITGNTPANFMTLNNDTRIDKWHNLMTGHYSGLIVLTKDTLYIFNHDDLMGAYAGDIMMRCRHTKEKGKKKWGIEKKAVIDLDKCKCKLNITPPKDLFT